MFKADYIILKDSSIRQQHLKKKSFSFWLNVHDPSIPDFTPVLQVDKISTNSKCIQIQIPQYISTHALSNV